MNEWRKLRRCVYHDGQKYWLDTDSGDRMRPLTPTPAKLRGYLWTGFPIMANLRKCWMSESTRGPGVIEDSLTLWAALPTLAFLYGGLLVALQGSSGNFHGTNTSLCISQQCLKAPRGIGGPAVLICRSDPEGQWPPQPLINPDSEKCIWGVI